jgi:hypothetical protein
MNTIFVGLEGFEGVKQGCQGEVQSENLAGGDWQRCGSPPMTPGMFVPCISFAGLHVVNSGEFDEPVLTSFCFCSVHSAKLAYEQRER